MSFRVVAQRHRLERAPSKTTLFVSTLCFLFFVCDFEPNSRPWALFANSGCVKVKAFGSLSCFFFGAFYRAFHTMSTWRRFLRVRTCARGRSTCFRPTRSVRRGRRTRSVAAAFGVGLGAGLRRRAAKENTSCRSDELRTEATSFLDAAECRLLTRLFPPIRLNNLFLSGGVYSSRVDIAPLVCLGI